MPTFKINTLGCKVNQSESETIARKLESDGWVPAGNNGAAEVTIINTCTVTQKASMQSRQAVRQAMEENVPGVLGIHLEGPFLAAARRGIHDASHFRTIDEDGFDDLGLWVGVDVARGPEEYVGYIQVGHAW